MPTQTRSLAELGALTGGGNTALQVANIRETSDSEAPTGGTLEWDAPTGAADSYTVELYRTKYLTDLINTGNTQVATNSMVLNFDPRTIKSLKITASRGGESGYIIIEDLIKN